MTDTKTIYLTGQNNFGNRGCEALVRSTVTVLTEALGPIKALVPSFDPKRDQAQWPESSSLGVEFVEIYPMPKLFSKWHGACQKFPYLQRLPSFGPKLSTGFVSDLERSDILLSIGGDNYSLDYGIASLFYFRGVAEEALGMSKPAVLWGASVGPFTKFPTVEKKMADHLNKLTLVTIRESRSVEYLRGIGVSKNVLPVVDSAFAMVPEVVDISRWWPKNTTEGVLGLNIGWLIDSIRRRDGAENGIISEVVDFVRHVLKTTELAIVLVPHVSPLNGNDFNNDEVFNDRLLNACGGASDRLVQVPHGLNAAQLKFVISKCRFLIAARTHATIAAFSTAVPTVSIAYSVKAKGINRDLFGHERYVLETPKVSSATLASNLQILLDEETAIRSQYNTVLPIARQRARAGAARLAEILLGK